MAAACSLCMNHDSKRLRCGAANSVILQPSAQDFSKPEEPRLREQLSAIVNFAKFREEKLRLWEGWSAEEVAELARSEALLERQAQLVPAHSHGIRSFLSFFVPTARVVGAAGAI